jgi:predicted HicB family RNase H-like nuclease
MADNNDTTELRIRTLPRQVHRALKQIALDEDISLEKLTVRALTEFAERETKKGGEKW